MINEVRNAVLSILNKNNYGYISPSDFNLYAANAQMEIYEEYYSSYNKTINAENARGSGTDYADIESPIAETLETFLVTDFLSNIGGNRFSVPTVATVGNDAYYILKLLCHPTLVASGNNTSVLLNSLVDSTATFIADGIDVDYVVVNLNTKKVALVETITSESTIKLSKNIFLASGENYRIYSTAVKELEKVSVGKITMLNASNLTKPSLLFPSYTLEGQTIKAYPNTINGVGQIEAVYFRFPKTPKWTYITLVSGEPVFDQSQLDYQDFELPNEDGYKLVTKILEYCGMSIRETEVVQFGMAQQQLSQQ
jgi:hypothetical protein